MDTTTFYSTAAQVIPVLFLIFVFEFRSRDAALVTPKGYIEHLYVGILLGLFFLGEAVSMVDLYHPPDAIDPFIVGAALTAGGTSVIYPAYVSMTGGSAAAVRVWIVLGWLSIGLGVLLRRISDWLG